MRHYDVAKLDNFKRNLLQTLQDDEENKDPTMITDLVRPGKWLL